MNLTSLQEECRNQDLTEDGTKKILTDKLLENLPILTAGKQQASTVGRDGAAKSVAEFMTWLENHIIGDGAGRRPGAEADDELFAALAEDIDAGLSTTKLMSLEQAGSGVSQAQNLKLTAWSFTLTATFMKQLSQHIYGSGPRDDVYYKANTKGQPALGRVYSYFKVPFYIPITGIVRICDTKVKHAKGICISPPVAALSNQHVVLLPDVEKEADHCAAAWKVHTREPRTCNMKAHRDTNYHQASLGLWGPDFI